MLAAVMMRGAVRNVLRLSSHFGHRGLVARSAINPLKARRRRFVVAHPLVAVGDRAACDPLCGSIPITKIVSSSLRTVVECHGGQT
jgi:hypothetical protein